MKRIDYRQTTKYTLAGGMHELKELIEREEAEIPQRIIDNKTDRITANHKYLRLRRLYEYVKVLDTMPHTKRDIESRIGQQTDTPEQTAPRSHTGGRLF